MAVARPLPVVDVAVGIVRAAHGRVLMAERTARQVAAGFWELPGGKIDPGETPAEAAARELDEEIGIRAIAMRPRIAYEHVFPTKRVRLHFFAIDSWSGAPRGREGQRLAWVDPAKPWVAPVLPSNERLLAALGLPPVCLALQPLHSGATAESLRRLAEALSDGVRCITVREPHLTSDQRIAFARRVDALAHRYGAHVLLDGTPLEAQRAGVPGFVSSAAELHRLTRRPSVRLWAATCHSARDLARAAALGADAAIVSPIFSNAPGDGTPFGWDGLRRLAESAPIAIYAEGGMTRALLPEAQRVGAAGIFVAEF
jgi:8-oxo-dGTP diphosphatase